MFYMELKTDQANLHWLTWSVFAVGNLIFSKSRCKPFDKGR